MQYVLFRNMYDLDFKEEGFIKLHIRKFLLFPEFWNDSSNRLPSNLRWAKLRFLKSNASKIPLRTGIYCFVVVPNYPNLVETRYLFYCGMTTRTLRTRFNDYINEQAGKPKKTRKKIYQMLNLYKDNIFFYYASIPSKRTLTSCEAKILNTFVPQVNTDIPRARIKPELKYIYE